MKVVSILFITIFLPVVKPRILHESLVDDWYVGFTTESPNPYPTIPSTHNPTLSPTTLQPARPFPCKVSNDRPFGKENVTNLQSKFLEYRYQLLYNNQSNIEAIILDIENDVANSIIKKSSIFPACSMKERQLRIERSNMRNQDSGVVAISSMPPDTVSTNEDCLIESNSKDMICSEINGIMTIFYEDESSLVLENDQSQIREVIKSTLTENKATNEIVHLKYIGQPGEASKVSLKENLIIISAAAGVAIFSVVLAIMRWSKKRVRANIHNETPKGSTINGIPSNIYSDSASDDYSEYNQSYCTSGSSTSGENCTVTQLTWDSFVPIK